MAQLTVVYWRDIPAQVIVKKGRRDEAKIQLSERFEKAIDRAAMKASLQTLVEIGVEGEGSRVGEVGDDLQAEASKKAAEIETEFDEAKLNTLVDAGGKAA